MKNSYSSLKWYLLRPPILNAKEHDADKLIGDASVHVSVHVAEVHAKSQHHVDATILSGHASALGSAYALSEWHHFHDHGYVLGAPSPCTTPSTNVHDSSGSSEWHAPLEQCDLVTLRLRLRHLVVDQVTLAISGEVRTSNTKYTTTYD